MSSISYKELVENVFWWWDVKFSNGKEILQIFIYWAMDKIWTKNFEMSIKYLEISCSILPSFGMMDIIEYQKKCQGKTGGRPMDLKLKFYLLYPYLKQYLNEWGVYFI